MPEAATPVRSLAVQLTPRLVPVCFSSAKVIDSDGKLQVLLPTEFVATSDGGVLNVAAADAEKLQCQYVYVFVTGASVAALVDQVHEDTLSHMFLTHYAKSKKNHLLAILRVSGPGQLQSVSMTADDSKRGSVTYSIARGMKLRAFGTEHLLDVEVTEKLSERFPEKDVEAFDPLSPRLYTFDMRASGESEPRRVLPVLDPLKILRGLAQKYNTACDAYARHIGDLEGANDDEGAAKGENAGKDNATGSVGFLKYRAAHVVAQLTEQGVSNSRARSKAERYIDSYEKAREKLRDEKEEAALNLIRWLESDSMRVLDELLRMPDGSFGQIAEPHPYVAYVEEVAFAQTRLPESDRGRAYLSTVLSELDSAQGSRRVISEFILPPGSPDADTAKIARQAASPLFNLWGQIYPLLTARVSNAVASYKIGPEEYVALNELAKKLCQQIAYLFDGEVFEIVHNKAIDLQIRIQDKLAQLHVDQVELKLNPKTSENALRRAKIATDTAEGILQGINGALAFSACREAVRKANYDVESLNSALSFAQALVFFGDKLQARPQLANLRKALFRVETAKVVSARLLMVQSVFDVAAAGPSAIDAYQQHDWNKAFAETVRGAGAVVTLAALALCGPVSLVGAVGFAMVTGGSIWSDLVTDNPYDKLVKFSAFGAWSPEAKMAEPDRAWTVATTYEDWNPSTKEGLETYLAAMNQMQFSFRAQGHRPSVAQPLASDGGVQIIASHVLPNSVFHLYIDSNYVLTTNPGVKAGPEPKGNCRITFSDNGQSATFHDGTGELRTEDVVQLSTDAEGRRVIELAIRLRNPDAKNPVTINHLTVKIRLDVLGDGTTDEQGANGSVVVPRTSAGGKRLRVIAVEGSQLQTPAEKPASFIGPISD